MLRLTRRSELTGNVHTMELNTNYEEYADWKSGTLIQNAMPNLSADEREFVKTGITPEEWDAYIKDKE